jgi:hypothetical protein
MIREKAILFKLNQIKLLDKQLFDSTPESYEICPRCGAEGCLRPHDFYNRDLISINNGIRTDDKISIKRVKCYSCKATHALLPDILIPFGSYSLRFILFIMRAYIFRTGTVNALCDYFCIAHTTLYKWIHLFNEQANLLLSSIEQISCITAPVLDFAEGIKALPSLFFERYRFSFLQNMKRRRQVPAPG